MSGLCMVTGLRRHDTSKPLIDIAYTEGGMFQHFYDGSVGFLSVDVDFKTIHSQEDVGRRKG